MLYIKQMIFRQCAASIRGNSCQSGCLFVWLVHLAKILSPNLISVTAWLSWPKRPYSTHVQSLAAGN